MTERKSDFTLPTNMLDDLFSTQEERDDAKLSKIRDIPIRGDRVRSLIPKSVPLDQTEEYIVKALKYYADFMRKRTERDSR